MTVLHDLPQIWATCRHANPYLAMLAWLAVSTRLSMMLFDRPRWNDRRALHLMAWFGWIGLSLLVSALGSAYYAVGPTPANYTSGLRLVLNVTAVVLSLWWPHPPRSTSTDTQER